MRMLTLLRREIDSDSIASGSSGGNADRRKKHAASATADITTTYGARVSLGSSVGIVRADRRYKRAVSANADIASTYRARGIFGYAGIVRRACSHEIKHAAAATALTSLRLMEREINSDSIASGSFGGNVDRRNKRAVSATADIATTN